MVVLHGTRLVAAGVVIGVASASGLTRLIASFLFGVEASDPANFVAVPAVLGARAARRRALPARRASRVDPVLALRGEQAIQSARIPATGRVRRFEYRL